MFEETLFYRRQIRALFVPLLNQKGSILELCDKTECREGGRRQRLAEAAVAAARALDDEMADGVAYNGAFMALGFRQELPTVARREPLQDFRSSRPRRVKF